MTDWRDVAFDLTRGLAAYAASPLIRGVARVIADHPEAEIGVAFNHKQVASKIWARDALHDVLGGAFGRIAILGGWYGVLAGMLFDDVRFRIGEIVSIDLDPAVAAVARTLNAHAGERFRAVSGDMYAVDYAALRADLVINTSCEHILDLGAWLARLPRGTQVLLQSNDYSAEPSHVACSPSLEAFAARANLQRTLFSGTLPTRKYRRFMLIGEA